MNPTRSMYLVVVAIIAAAAMCWGNSLTFQNMTATFNGQGNMTVGEKVADYMYTLNIVNSTSETVSGTLTITPKEPNHRNEVFIDSINCVGSLMAIKITFPPGRTIPCYIRNIRVTENLGNLTVEGGDLGASDGQDGIVYVGGSIGTIDVKGKRYRYTNDGSSTSYTEWWGGNIWADITASGSIHNIKSKGGNFYYDQYGGILGTIALGGDLGTFSAKGEIIKTNSTDTTSEIYRGGNINANIIGSEKTVIKSLETKGGLITDGLISCQQIQKILTTGQKPLDTFYMPLSSQGVFKTYVIATDAVGDGQDSDFKTFTVKNGSIRDSLFAIKGDIGNVSITSSGGSTNETCLISNVIMRAGFVGDLSESNLTPVIYPTSLSTTVLAGAELIIPFAVTGQTNEDLTIRTHYRGRALTSVVSNMYGQWFSGTNRWHTTETTFTGFFVWVTYTNNVGMSSNVVVRVRDNGTPNKYCDLRFSIKVVTNVNPVILLMNPADNPRTNTAGIATIVWSMHVYEPMNQGPITYQATGMSAFELGITVTNTDPQTAYAYTTKGVLLPGSYTDIVFTANNGVFSDRKIVTLVLTGSLMGATAALPEWSDALPEDCPASTDTVAHAWDKWEGSYDGNITKISTVGSVFDSMFVASTSDNPPYMWSNAFFFGHFNNLKINGISRSNTFVSSKKVTITKTASFDYTNNFLWVDGERVMSKDHDY